MGEIDNLKTDVAVKHFHETVTQEGCYAFTTVWKNGHWIFQAKNFSSVLLGEDSFEWCIAGAINVAAEEYGVSPKKLAQEILKNVDNFKPVRPIEE